MAFARFNLSPRPVGMRIRERSARARWFAASLMANVVLLLITTSKVLHGRHDTFANQGVELERRLAVDEGALQSLRAVQSAGAAPAKRRWLTIGIPTVPRQTSNTTYLQRTVESLLDELPAGDDDLWSREVEILVMNNAPGRHPEYEALRRALGRDTSRFAAKARRHITWLDNPGTVRDPTPDAVDPDDLHNPEDRPGRQVRQQTCDLITLLRHAAPLSRFYLFMEDDFEVCPYALRALQIAAAKADAQEASRGWAALRVSYGMNGVLLHSADITPLADYLWEHVTRKPPDLLWAEWIAGQGKADPPRPYAVYRYNVLNHLGAVSSFAVRPDRRAWPKCWDAMANAWSLAMNERYAQRCRAVSDVSPCGVEAGWKHRAQAGGAVAQEAWARHQLNWTAPVRSSP